VVVTGNWIRRTWRNSNSVRISTVKGRVEIVARGLIQRPIDIESKASDTTLANEQETCITVVDSNGEFANERCGEGMG
jgi:hypothetical protein